MVARTAVAVVDHNLALKVLEVLAQFAFFGPEILVHFHQHV
jgi:hypothetical protein